MFVTPKQQRIPCLLPASPAPLYLTMCKQRAATNPAEILGHRKEMLQPGRTLQRPPAPCFALMKQICPCYSLQLRPLLSVQVQKSLQGTAGHLLQGEL